MNHCKYCHDDLAEWNTGSSYRSDDWISIESDVCHYCFYDIDDDDKFIDKMEHNEDVGRPDKKLARAYQRYLNG